jgi:hypothetical protein
LIDYEKLNAAGADAVEDMAAKAQAKINEIDNDVDKLVQHFDRAKEARHEAFRKDMSPEELRELRSKNLLPENVIFKMLQRYAYAELMYALKKLTKEGEMPIDTPQEVKKVQDIVKKHPTYKAAAGEPEEPLENF